MNLNLRYCFCFRQNVMRYFVWGCFQGRKWAGQGTGCVEHASTLTSRSEMCANDVGIPSMEGKSMPHHTDTIPTATGLKYWQGTGTARLIIVGPTTTLAGWTASGVVCRNPSMLLDARELAMSSPPVQDMFLRLIFLDGRLVTGFAPGKFLYVCHISIMQADLDAKNEKDSDILSTLLSLLICRPGCGVHNYACRTECFRCKMPQHFCKKSSLKLLH